MDPNTQWPWSWAEELEWKADLEERDYDFIDELINDTVDDGTTESRYNPSPSRSEANEDRVPEEYSVTA